MKIDRMGVLVLVAHLIITLAMIAAYVLFSYLDKSTSAIENMLLIAVGFWFASMGQNAIRPNQQPQQPEQKEEQKGA
jgi:hypothetical protein